MIIRVIVFVGKEKKVEFWLSKKISYFVIFGVGFF